MRARLPAVCIVVPETPAVTSSSSSSQWLMQIARNASGGCRSRKRTCSNMHHQSKMLAPLQPDGRPHAITCSSSKTRHLWFQEPPDRTDRNAPLSASAREMGKLPLQREEVRVYLLFREFLPAALRRPFAANPILLQ